MLIMWYQRSGDYVCVMVVVSVSSGGVILSTFLYSTMQYATDYSIMYYCVVNCPSHSTHKQQISRDLELVVP